MGKKKKAPVAIVTTSNEDSALQIQPPALDIDQLYSDLALSLECPLCLEALKDPVIFCPNVSDGMWYTNNIMASPLWDGCLTR